MAETREIDDTEEAFIELVEESAVPHPAPQREWPLLTVLAGVHFTHIMDFMMIMPLGPQFMRLFHIAPQQFGLLVSVYTFSAGICGFVAAFFIDRFDRKNSLMVLYGGFALATLLCAVAPGYGSLLAARAVAGGFGGITGATVLAIIGDVIPEYRRGAATGTVLSAFSVAAVAGVPTGLFLANHFNWRAPFLFLTVASLLILVAAWRVLPHVRAHLAHEQETHPLRQIQVIFFNRNHLNAFALIATLMFAGFSVIPFISPYLVANVGLNETDLPYVYFAGGLMTFFTARLVGRLADRHGKRRVFAITALISIGPMLTLTHLPRVSVALAILVSTLFMVFQSGRFVPAMAMITSSVAPRLRGSFMSFNSAVQQVSAGFASLAAGMIIGKSPAGALTHYGVVGMIAVVATIICVFLARSLEVHQERPVIAASG